MAHLPTEKPRLWHRQDFRPTIRMSYATMRARLHTLGFPEVMIQACVTVGDAQSVARPYYLAQARRLHPDHVRGRGPRANAITGRGFQAVKKTYDWLMDLAPCVRLQRFPDLPCPMVEHEYPDVGWGFNIEYH